ncbi:hypothetical protein FGO68_gene8176 [Halteria grandinella]|uniref:Uncharacterized protein n=1 Tax=Halteria grandinella TaxID=5974 RepID=A0A8J8NJ09_HALGN|nr:hypothetical protein FGO68_gene8176 [Halteria grandinella]
MEPHNDTSSIDHYRYEVISDKSLSQHDVLFKDEHDVTVGVEFGSFMVRIEDRVVKLQIWDTAGQESFRSITKIFYRGAHAAILGYSIARRDSFENLNDWANEVRASCSHDVLQFLIGNKSDMEREREVTIEEGANFKRQQKLTYFKESSAKTGENVEQIFVDLAKFLYHKHKPELHRMIEDNVLSQSSQGARRGDIQSIDRLGGLKKQGQTLQSTSGNRIQSQKQQSTSCK